MRNRRKQPVPQKRLAAHSVRDGRQPTPSVVQTKLPEVSNEPANVDKKPPKKQPRIVQVRRPLQVHAKRQQLQARLKRERRKATNNLQLQSSLQHAGRSYTGTDIHPIAVLSWLTSNEPFHADMLRDALAGDLKALPGGWSPAMAIEMEKLVDSLNTSSLANDNILANPLIDIPRGYGMQLVCYSKDFGALIAKAKRMETGIFHMSLPGKGKAHADGVERKYGFDPCEILKKYAIHFPPLYNLRSSTLTNDVHPILRLDNFHGCPDDIYKQLIPGLRLATRLLLHRSTAHFWHTIAFGERVLDEALTITHGHSCFRLPTPLPYNEENIDRFMAFLDRLVTNVHIHFSLWPLPKQEGLYAGMAIVGDYKRGEILSSQKETHRKCRICLHTDFYTTAARLAKLQNPEPSLILRFNFFVAMTICHELAHLVEMNGSHEGAAAGREAYWGSSSRRPEMGSAFEEAVFGGKVHPIGARVDCAWGCTVYDNPDTTERSRLRPSDFGNGKSKPRRGSSGEQLGLLCDLTKFYTVPMDYIAKLQQSSTWDAGAFDEDDLDAGKALIIPRDGAQAISVPVFDMVVWEDEAANPVSDETEGLQTPFRRLEKRKGIEKYEKPVVEKPKSKEVSMAGIDLDFEDVMEKDKSDSE